MPPDNNQISDYTWEFLHRFRSTGRSNIQGQENFRQARALEALTYEEFLKFLARTDEPPRNLLRVVTQESDLKDTAIELLMELNSRRSGRNTRSIRITFSRD